MYRTDPRTAPACTLGGIRDRMLTVTDAELVRLGHAWRTDEATERARDAALHPELPGVLTALELIDEVDAVFAEESTQARTRRGVHAVRDAVAAAAAADGLSPAHARLLLDPWLRLPAPAGPPLSATLPAATAPLLELAGRAGQGCHDNDAYALDLTLRSAARGRRHEQAATGLAEFVAATGQRRLALLATHATRHAYTRPHHCTAARRILPRGATDDAVAVLAAAVIAVTVEAPASLLSALVSALDRPVTGS